MSNTELKEHYADFIAMIGKSDGLGLHGFLQDLASHLDGIAYQKEQAWRDSGFQTSDNGNHWRNDAHALRVVAGTNKPKVRLYQRLAQLIAWNNRCIHTRNSEWLNRTLDAINALMDTAPSGSGIDSGTKLNGRTEIERKRGIIRFQANFHHMNDGGIYGGWTEHEVIVSPSLENGFELNITGKDRNEIKNYLHEVYSTWLNTFVDADSFVEKV